MTESVRMVKVFLHNSLAGKKIPGQARDDSFLLEALYGFTASQFYNFAKSNFTALQRQLCNFIKKQFYKDHRITCNLIVSLPEVVFRFTK